MSILTVGSGQQFSTIASAVNAAADGDTINVAAGTYTNDFVTVSKSLTLNAVGGTVTMNATVQPPDGKAILTEGGNGVTVNINGFVFKGAKVPDGNGAGIRYQGGTLHIENSGFFNNENGILGAADPNGVITIDHSEFGGNGVNGDGHTHNMYIGAINSFSLTNSYSHDAIIGHEVKSRAGNNTITGNVIADNNGTSSYEIDLPNGGNSVISNNIIEQGPNSQNPNIIAIGEEGTSNTTSTISLTGNTIVNDLGRGPALWNATGTTADFSNNSVYGFGGNALVNGPANQSGTTVLGSRPTFTEAVPAASSSPIAAAPVATPTPTPTPTPADAPAPDTGLVVDISEDAYQGDAQYEFTVDGQQIGGVYTASAAHGSGSTQAISLGTLKPGNHQVGVTFLNDRWEGTPQTDRNLYVDGASYNGNRVSSAAGTLLSAGAHNFTVSVPGTTTATNMTTTNTTTGTTPVAATQITPAPTSTGGLVVNLSEDAYQGDAQFVATVDGQQVSGVHTITALHGAGQSQAINLGTVAAGRHQFGITFLNDAYAGTSNTDRNLYVDSASYNGQQLSGASAALFSAGTSNFGFTNNQTTSSNAVINVSEDAYQGDAQFIISVDGQQQGGVYTATASHAAGQYQAISLSNLFETFQPHDIALTFLNDKWDGTPATDRNLYVNSVQFDGQTVPGAAAALYSAGTSHFTAVAPANWTG